MPEAGINPHGSELLPVIVNSHHTMSMNIAIINPKLIGQR